MQRRLVTKSMIRSSEHSKYSRVKWTQNPYLERNNRAFVELQMGFPGGSAGKESACNAGDLGLIPGFGKIPWRRLPTPVFLPAKSRGQRSGVTKELDSTWRLNNNRREKCTGEMSKMYYILFLYSCFLGVPVNLRKLTFQNIFSLFRISQTMWSAEPELVGVLNNHLFISILLHSF